MQLSPVLRAPLDPCHLWGIPKASLAGCRRKQTSPVEGKGSCSLVVLVTGATLAREQISVGVMELAKPQPEVGTGLLAKRKAGLAALSSLKVGEAG